jgi:serine protease Do
MATRKSTVFYGVLIAFISLVGGMILASRLDLAPGSFARTFDVPTSNSAPLSGPIDATTFRNIAKEASPSVVSIKVMLARQVPDPTDMFGFELPFPFGNQRGPQQQQPPRRQQPREQLQQGAGSGFIIDKAGYILTNNHVVEDAKSIEVYLSTMNMRDGEDGLPAKVIGRDELSDTALIQLTALPKEPLQPARFGDSDQMAPGDWAVAIGNPFLYSNSVTVGIISAVGRHNEVSNGRSADFIQTDAAINHGNSGGPLLNLRGEVIGINTMIATDGPLSGNVGVGFAIPINTVRDLLPQLQQGKVTRGRIGVRIDSRPMSREDAEDLGLSNTSGALVAEVENGGPAKAAGVAVGDVIIEFNGRPVKNSGDLVAAVTRTAPGTTVPVKVVRNKKVTTLNVKVEELDLAQEQASLNGGRSRPGEDRSEPQDTGFGMSIQPVQPREQRQLQLPAGRGGAIVTDVEPFGPAAQGGVTPGDVILSIQGQPVHSVDEVTRGLAAVPAGRTARLVVWRFANGQGVETLVQIRKR